MEKFDNLEDLLTFFDYLIENQIDLDEDFKKILFENLHDLYQS